MLLLLCFIGCDEENAGRRYTPSEGYGPPANPPHTRREEGVAHARLNNTPFLCGSPEGPVTCPDDLRPEPEFLSCDAVGCHGGYAYDPAQDWDARHLYGSDGPSCWTCHNQEWAGVKIR